MWRSGWAARLLDYMAAIPEPGHAATGPASWLRPKGNMTRGDLAVLLALALLPLVSAALRTLALPGILSPGMSGTLLPSIGQDLNQILSLQNIPSADRDRILYMLFLPTGAILIALARLTFGLRLIGFRSILISVGFQHSGIGPSLLLIATMVTVVIAIRPALVRFRLAYFPRVAVIMSVSVLLLISVLLIAPWAHSDDLWGVAFFPVIVLGLMAEGIAKTIDRESSLSALSRTLVTIGIALVLAVISHIALLREIAIEFPELVITQIVAIILIAEFLDLRLFQDWDARLSGIAVPRLFSASGGLHIAVVRNDRNSGVIGRLGQPSRGGYRRRSVRRVVDVLRTCGHVVKVFEGDMTLLAKLQAFIPPDPRTQRPGGIVLNLAHGIQGEGAAAHVPALLEMSGLPYTGPTPRGLTIAMDRVVTRTLLRAAGISTPDCRVFDDAHNEYVGLTYPVVIKPRVAVRYKLRVARNRRELDDELRRLDLRNGHGAVAEPYVEGRAFEVAILGNAGADCLPLVEVLSTGQGIICPALVARELERAICSAALGAFRACACRDYALIGIRIAPSGEPLVMEVEVDGVLEEGEPFAVAAEAAGLPYTALLNRVIHVARQRYRPEAALPGVEMLPAPGDAVAHGGRAVVAR